MSLWLPSAVSCSFMSLPILVIAGYLKASARDRSCLWGIPCSTPWADLPDSGLASLSWMLARHFFLGAQKPMSCKKRIQMSCKHTETSLLATQMPKCPLATISGLWVFNPAFDSQISVGQKSEWSTCSLCMISPEMLLHNQDNQKQLLTGTFFFFFLNSET